MVNEDDEPDSDFEPAKSGGSASGGTVASAPPAVSRPTAVLALGTPPGIHLSGRSGGFVGRQPIVRQGSATFTVARRTTGR